ncbi:MAG: hypothetical protein ACREF6_01990 [Alphaproteobacteria bacterium]
MAEAPLRSSVRIRPSPARLALGFAAGFLAVLVFHQSMYAFLYAIGYIANPPYPVQPIPPFGLPRFWSLAFWGGVWGIIFVLVEQYFPRGAKYWLAALLFGALAPSLVDWFIVAPIKGTPIAGGWKIDAMMRGLILNGAWGLGTAAVLWLFARVSGSRP